MKKLLKFIQLVKLRPITNGLRHQFNIQKNLLYKTNKFIKNLNIGFKKFSGRSSITGQITVRHKGNGCKKIYKKILYKNDPFFAIVLGFLYDPNRSAFICLNFNMLTKSFFHTLGVTSVSVGSIICCNKILRSPILGFRSTLASLPVGALLNSISLSKNTLAHLVRAAGTSSQIVQQKASFVTIKLPSNKFLQLSLTAYGTLGSLSNSMHNRRVLGKAGKNRLRGIRPSVRGIAMNPVDHPHGGRTNGCQSMTPWGIPTRGKITVKKK